MWDYVGDGYVHRLIQGHGVDKVVEYNQGGGGNLDEKMESVTLEVLYYPAMLSPFSPAPVKTDRAVRVQ